MMRKRIVMLIVAVMLVQMFFVVKPRQAKAVSLPNYMTVPEGYYIMRARNNNDYAVSINYHTNNVCMREVNSHYNEVIWRFMYMGNGLYTIENHDTKKYLDVTEYGAGEDVCIFRDQRPQQNELWYVVNFGRYVYLVPYCKSWKALDIDNGDQYIGDQTNVHLWDQNALIGCTTQLLTLDRSPNSREECAGKISIPDYATINNGTYSIRPMYNYEYCVNSNDSNQGTSINLWYYYEQDDFEHWEFSRVRDCLYSIKNVGSNKYLDVSDWGRGSDVVQYRDGNPAINELWYVVPAGNVYVDAVQWYKNCYYLIPYCQITKSLDLLDGISRNNQNIQIYNQNLEYPQKFILEMKGSSNNGLNITPTIRMIDYRIIALGSGVELEESTDYIVTNYVDNGDGTATITIEGIGEYSGTTTQTVSIEGNESIYTVTYDANGGTGAPSTQTMAKGRDLTLSAVTPIRDGYVFLGWSSDPMGAVEYTAGSVYEGQSDTTLYAIWGLQINATHFPDSVFRAYIHDSFDTNGDGILSRQEIGTVTSINVSNRGIGSLQGIEYFFALTDLYCEENDLMTLDISYNHALKHLNCSQNQLTVLDLSGNPSLLELICEENQLTSLDLNATMLSMTSVYSGYNTYSIKTPFDLSNLPGNFDITRASEWSGGSIDNTVLTAPEGVVTYKYDCGNDSIKTFRLIVTEANIEPPVPPVPDITLPDSLKVIEEEAFSGNSFHCVLIPQSVKEIRENAFSSCNDLLSVIVLSDDVFIHATAFGDAKEVTIYAHRNSLAHAYADKYDYRFIAIE